jgi:autotransporter-associated beta strand protein
MKTQISQNRPQAGVAPQFSPDLAGNSFQPNHKHSNAMKSKTQKQSSITSLFSSAPLAGIVKTMAAAAAATALLAGFSARAQYTWDPSQNKTGSDGAGTWDTTSLFWASGGVDVAWPNTATSVAIIGDDQGTAGTITLSSSTIITNNGITFNSALSGNYILTGGTNYLAGTTPTITVNATSATNLSAIQGASGLTTAGTGTLVLGGSNSYSGATAITAGTLQLTNTSMPAPLLYMSFNDVSGTTVINQGTGGAAMNGTLTGTATIATGAGVNGGNALSIPSGAANAAYVLINSPVVAMTGSGKWTIAMWVQTSTAGGVYAYQGSGGWVSGNMVFYLNEGSDGGYGTKAGGVSWGQGWEEGTTAINNGAWHFLVMTCNGSTKAMYLDGNVDAITSSWSASTGVGSQFWIGGAADTGDKDVGLAGLIDDVYVYNVALTQAQVQAIMNASGPTWPTQLPAATTVNVTSPAKLDLNGNNLIIAGLTGNGTVDTTLTGGTPTLSINASSADNFTGILKNTTGALSLVASGTGNLTLSGVNTYTGSTTVGSGGTLTIGGAGQLNSGSYAGTIYDAGTFSYNSTANQTLTAAITGTGGLTLNGGLSTTVLSLGTSSSSPAQAFTGPTVVNSGTLSVWGANTTDSGLYLSSSITINNGGTILVNGDNAFQGQVSPSVAGPVTINAGGTLTGLSTADSGAGPSCHIPGLLILNGGTLADGGTGAQGAWGSWNLFGGVAVPGTSTTTSTMSAPDIIPCQAGGTLFNITNGGTASGIDLNVTGTLIKGTSQADTGIIKNGNGTMALDSANTYTGTTTINGGKLILNGTGSLGGGDYTANIPNNGTFIDASTTAQTLGGVISGTGALQVNGSGVALTLSGADTYSGPTVVNAGTLYLSGSGSISDSSSITVTNGGIFDVSSLNAYTMGASQNLIASNATGGAYAVNGSVVTGSGSMIYPGGNGSAVGLLTFNGSLTLSSGSAVNFDLSTSHSGANDQMTVTGTLTVNNNTIQITALTPGSPLDTTDYVLMTATSISGTFNTAPSWAAGAAPSNPGNYTVVTTGTQVTLHYSPTTGPTISTGTANSSNPATVTRNQNVLISVTVVKGTGTINPNTGVSLNLAPLGGSSVYLILSGTPYVYTNTITIPPGTTAGGPTINLDATVTDSTPLSGSATIGLNVVASTKTWNGGGALGFENFDNNTNWAGDAAPGYVGDTLVFAQNLTAGPNPYMDNPYTVAGLSFSSGAPSFNITPDGNSDALTLSGGAVVNNSANPQTLSVPITLTAAQAFDATAGNIILGGAIADSGNGLTVNGPYAVSLTGDNTYTGPSTLDSGTLNLTGTVIPSYMITGGAAGNSVMNISGSGSLTAIDFFVGNYSNAVSAVYQTGGTVTLTGALGDDLCLGNAAGSFGYYDAIGGTLAIDGICVAGEEGSGDANPPWPPSTTTAGNGIMEINGATVNNTGWVVMTRAGNAETGILNVYSGSLTYGVGGIEANWGSGQTAIINILGGSVTSATLGVDLSWSGSGTGILNLNGGLLEATSVINGAPGNVNFNGGTLEPSTASTAFIAVTSATIYSGGATINNNGQSITVAQPLLAPAGNGVATPTITTKGAGYIAPPIVLISGGGGTGATAIAQIDTNSASLTFSEVTNVIVTCPGINYTSPPTFTLSGGGFTTAATITGTAPLPNTSGGLTVMDSVGGGNLTLTGVNTYTGPTTISNDAGYLSLGVGGSISNSPIINVQSGGTFDVSAQASPSLGASQNLEGSGTVYTGSATLATGANSVIYPGAGANGGTLAINGNLTMTIGSTAVFDLSSSSSGNNDTMVVGGALNLNGNVLHIAAASLDGTDYTLIQAGSISGSFASAPVWDVKPANYLNYSVVNSGSTVVLHYSTYSPPTGTGSASPTNVLRNEPTTFTVNTTPGSGGYSIQSVNITLNNSGYPLSEGPANVWTTTITIPPATPAGSLILSALITDQNNDAGNALIPLTIMASTETWSGGDTVGNENFDDNLDWAIEAGRPASYAPGYVGDSLVFANNGGTAGPNPSMDQSYTIGSLTFSSGASSFDIGTSGYTLTLSGAPVVNNSVNPQTLNVPITLTAAQPFDATAGNITISGAIADSGNGLTVAGPYTVSLTGNNTYTGPTLVNSGGLAVPGLISPTGVITVGDVYGSNAVMNIDGGTVQANNTAVGQFGSSLVVGTVSGSAGDVRMSGSGSVLTTSEQLGLGAGAGGYAAFSMSGGTADIGSFLVVGYNGDLSVVNMSGGALSIGNNLMTIAAGGTASIAVVTLSGGTFTSTATSGYAPTIGGTFVGEFGTGTLNVSGSALLTLSGWGLRMGHNAGASGTVNLLGGTINTVSVSQGSGSALFNFNGGTLQASTANTAFMPNLNSAYVYSGGAIIDENGNDITIGQPLLAPSGLGISSIPLTSHGSGYIDTPIVTITGGSGSGATAVAQINPATGAVTNIWITNPGNGYASGDAGSLVITFLGGGGSGAVAGTPVLAADGGGLTVIDTAGGGQLTLTNASTYTGPTTISNGANLALGVGGSINDSSIIEVTNGATFDVSALTSYAVVAGQTLTGSGTVNGNVTVNGTVSPGETAGIGALNLNGNNLTLTGSANFRINKTGSVLTSDEITGIGTAFYSGNLVITSTGSTALAVNDSFTLFSADTGSGSFNISGVPGVTFSFNANTGVLTVASVGPVINPNPPKIGFTYNASSGVLTLSWTTNAGWILQSNSISLADTNDWFTVAGSTNVTSVSITNNKSSPAVFYRMVYP